MSIYKQDILEAKERLKAWWDHELIDRPVISCYTPKPEVKLTQLGDILDYFEPRFLAENWDLIDKALDDFEKTSKLWDFKGECIPDFFPFYGPGIMASVFGIVPIYKSRTVWFHRETSIDEIVPLLESTKLNGNNEWYQRLLKATEIAAIRGKSDFSVTLTDMGGILDVLSSFLGPTKLILTMKRNPNLIETCCKIILEKWMIVYKKLQDIIDKYGNGCNSWMHIWCPKRWYPIQCDFSAFLSPKWFKQFVLPDIKFQAENLDYSIYHLDGPDALKHIDDLLNIEALTGIEWVPGAGRELKCNDKWMPLYKKIQKAGKSAIIDYVELPEFLPHFYKELDPKYLYTSIIFTDFLKAQFFLPKFIGGKEGEGDFKVFKKIYRKNLKSEENKGNS